MTVEDTFKTITDKVGEGFYTEKRSKFIAFAHHVTTIEQVKNIISDYRKKYYDGRHYCYAYMLGSERKVMANRVIQLVNPYWDRSILTSLQIFS